MTSNFSHPIIDKYIESNEFGRLLGIDFTIQEPGICFSKILVNSEHSAIPKVAHGGFTAALMDATMGVGALSLVCREMKVVSTIEIKISFFNPVLINTIVSCKSYCVRQGKSILFMEGELRDESNRILAKGSGSFNAYPAESVLF
jgi:uncharacterized protein (TIGR00369 family)